ncbi:unnamed protein product [Peronospora farinosa]|uniref:GOLD domain-containing protein n=1 Tax=Peronospora farinosa TaxID=134698 RepID=A0AAV0SWA6_9STRA|nr:unnamed protein product [Peronospora farinosa]CAI5709649.1 unnamed protein product [Peronospora farinosa]
MTRRAKERRTMRVQAKQQQLDENLMREKRLSSRASWIQLLSAIDGPYLSTNSSSLHVSSSDGLIKSPIVNELQWKSLQVPIAASGGFQLPIKLDARKGELFFSFSTRDYDVNFGVQMICADGSLIELLGTRRYESQKKQVQGQLTLTGPGMVLLLWDNFFSWVNTKQLAYHVELKQETLPVFAAGKTQLALKARLEREKKLMQYEGEYDRLETQVQTEERRVELLHHQIEELQTQLRKHEEAKENAIKKKDQVDEHIGDLFWELRALSWRCFDQTVLHRILDFLEEKDMAAWSLTSKKCYAHAYAYQSNRRKSA